MLHQVAEQDEIVVGARATARRYLHVDDVAEAVRASIGRAAGEIINIQGPKLVTLGDVVDISAHILGRNPVVIETAPGEPSVRRVSSDKAERLLGWRAGIDIASGVERLATYFDLTPKVAASMGAR